MKKQWISLITFAFFLLLVSWQANPVQKNYDTLWKKVRQYTAKDLPRSALETVRVIYNKAKSEGNQTQVVKSLLFRISLQSKFQEAYPLQSIRLFEKEKQSAPGVEKALLNSLLGQLCQEYYERHKYKIMNRISAAGDTSLETMGAMQWEKKIRSAYLASVADPSETQAVSLKHFAAILHPVDSLAFTVWPTLYDLLAHRALQYFSYNSSPLRRGGPGFSADTGMLAPAPEFVKRRFADSTSQETTVLRLFQHLLRLHWQQHNTEAFVDADLQRLNYVMRFLSGGSFSNRLAYSHALEKLFEKYRNDPVSVRIANALAAVYTGMDRTDNKKVNYRIMAEKLCRDAVKKFPQAPYANNCRNRIAQINRPDFSLKIQQALLPDKPFLARFTVKDVPQLWFKAVRLPAAVMGNFDGDMRKLMKQYLKKPAIKTWKQSFPFANDHRKHSAEVALPALPHGFYVIFVSDDPRFSEKNKVLYRQVQVTRLALLSQKNNAAKALDVYLLDRYSGWPVTGASVKAYSRFFDWRMHNHRQVLLGSFTSDETGFLQISMKNNDNSNGYLLRAVKAGDTTYASSFAAFYGNLYEQKPYERTYFFTDRAVYRPGQTVYFKAVQVKLKGNDARVVAGKKLVVNFRGPQYKKLDAVSLVTDSSGSVSGSFILPDEALNGRFILQTSTGSRGILMENYKRPAFYIAFDSLKKAFSLGDSVTFSGKVAYYFGGAGAGLPVRYTVKRQSFFPVFWHPETPASTTLATGTAHTDAKGRFRISFRASANRAIPENDQPVYRFILHTEVTDGSGETHAADKEVRLSQLSVLLHLDMPQNVVTEQAQHIEISAENLSGVPVAATVHIALYRLTPPSRSLLPALWPAPDTVLISKEDFVKNFPHEPFGNEWDKSRWPRTELASIDLKIKGKEPVFPSRLSGLKPGDYLVVAGVPGQTGGRVRKYFTVSSVKAKKLSLKSIFWHSLSQTKAEPGNVLYLSAGSEATKLHLLYELLNGKHRVQKEWVTAGKKLVKFAIPVQEAYRGNFAVRLTAVFDNRFFTWQQTIRVPFTDKKLEIGLETNRNYLKPGEKEQWTVTVSNMSGLPQPAFLVAGLYDASLDVYAANRWKMFPYHDKTAGLGWQGYLFRAADSRILSSLPENSLPETVLVYPRVNWFGYPVFSRRGNVYATAMKISEPAVAPRATAVAGEKEEKPPKKEINQAVPPETKTLPPPPLRTDFNETAFFYPDLFTNKEGKVSFSFTVPDALTQWKFMALAYTGGMKSGYFEKKMASRKALSVLPNLPRFVRRGDRLLFTARLSNLSTETLPVTVNITFFDPQSGKNLNLFLQRSRVQQRRILKPGENGLVSWLIHIPDSINFLGYRIRAVSGARADGEERMIPVLPNRQLITESLPLFVGGGQQKTFRFDRFLANPVTTRQNFRYTLTFTAHPAWYAVQALPVLDKPEYESAENLFYRYYAHALAGKLMETYPQIQQVFEQWKQHSPDAFLSALEKNKALKNVVLQATPWLLEAQNESEQKRRVALFFDLNQMHRKQQAALARLQAVQLPSGAWPWFPDMPADFYTTQDILSGLAALIRMQVIDLQKQPDVKIMLKKGVHYLDNKMERKYLWLKKRYPKSLNKNHLTASQVRYCYLRSALMQILPPDEKTQQAFDYFSGQIKRFWPGLDNDLQALAAMTLNRLGWKYEAEAVIRALNEKSLLNAQHGMYWRNDNPYAPQSAVSTETDIMKAFAEVMHDTRSVNRMKTWLIMQKQADRWPGTKATADAVYALLMQGSPLLSETQPVQIILGNGIRLPGRKTSLQAGTGFFTASWQGQAITTGLGTLTVKNPNKSMAYGAAYWQYFQDLDKVTGQAANVSIKKELYKQIGEKWLKITEDSLLHPGERVMVRLVVRSGRAVDFVEVEDMRAAAFEPETLLSSYHHKGGLSYYEDIKDAVTRFFIRHLPKGTFVLEYPLVVTRKGVFSNGIARIQSLYLPSFSAHSSGRKIKVE